MEYSATTPKSEVGVSMYVCEYVYVCMCANVTFHSPAQVRGMRKLRFYIDFGIGYTNTFCMARGLTYFQQITNK